MRFVAVATESAGVSVIMSKFDTLSDQEIQIIEFCLEDFRIKMREQWDQISNAGLGWDIHYIYDERGRQARALADLLNEIAKERHVRDTAKRLQLAAN